MKPTKHVWVNPRQNRRSKTRIRFINERRVRDVKPLSEIEKVIFKWALVALAVLSAVEAIR